MSCYRRVLIECAMLASVVVVLVLGQHVDELSLVEDEHPVQTFSSDRAHPPLGIRVALGARAEASATAPLARTGPSAPTEDEPPADAAPLPRDAAPTARHPSPLQRFTAPTGHDKSKERLKRRVQSTKEHHDNQAATPANTGGTRYSSPTGSSDAHLAAATGHRLGSEGETLQRGSGVGDRA
jgi:hypothetical protein